MRAQDVAIVILAAGNARRFGSDKLMAAFDGAPLGLHVAKQLLQVDATVHVAVCQPGATVVPHYAELGLDIAENPYAELGLSGSLHVGVEAAIRSGAQALLIALADMPFVQASHIEALIAACDGEIIASSNGQQSMPPAIFPRSTWPRLLQTKGDSGARDILEGARSLVAPEGSLRDVDTPDHLAALKSQPHRIDLPE